MTEPHEPDRDRIIDALGELVDALDRRMAHVERVGESRIARDADLLRSQAKQRIEELRAGAAAQQIRDAELPGAVMSDDGGPIARE